LLSKIRPRQPQAALRKKILDAAFDELSRSVSLCDRIWASKRFWMSAAAAITIGLVLPHIFSSQAPGPIRPPSPTPEAVQAAKELSEMMGDGVSLQERFAAQLSGQPKMNGGEAEKIEDWIERG